MRPRTTWQYLVYSVYADLKPQKPANDDGPIYVPDDDDLRRPMMVRRLVDYLSSYECGRREMPDVWAITIYGFGGRILWANEKPFYVSDTAIDDAFNDDGSFRWISDFLKLKYRPIKQKAQRRILPRLRLIYICMKIDMCRGQYASSSKP